MPIERKIEELDDTVDSINEIYDKLHKDQTDDPINPKEGRQRRLKVLLKRLQDRLDKIEALGMKKKKD